MIKQISVFIENVKDDLEKITNALGENGIDLVSLSIADTVNQRIMRCIVEDSDKALKVIKQAGFTAKTTEVFAVEVPDRPGGLAEVLGVLGHEGIEIEYLYSFVRSKTNNALIVFRVEEIERAIGVLKDSGVRILSGEEVCRI